MDEALSLEELWRTALAQPMHGAACGCSGAAVPTVVDAAMLEMHLLDFLEDKYELQRERAWSQAVALRTDAPRDSFVHWLQSLTGLAPEVHRHLIADTATVLQNMLEHARARLRPVGAQQRGWLTPG